MSSIVWLQDKVIPLNSSFLLIVGISLLMSKIDAKMTCLAYVIPIVYILDWFLVAIGVKREWFELSYNKLVYLVGVLHFVEGIYALLWAGKESVPIVAYKDEKRTVGYQTYHRWFIPLFFFTVQGQFVPIIGAVVYFNESFKVGPREKGKLMGKQITALGLIFIALAWLGFLGICPVGVTLLLMPILHECLFVTDYFIEKRMSK